MATEQLLDMPDADEAQRYEAAVQRMELDAHLAPYDLSGCARWSSLSCHVSAALISALSPVGGNISVMAEADDPDLLQPKTEAERQLVQQLQQGRAKLSERMASLGIAPPTELPPRAKASEVRSATLQGDVDMDTGGDESRPPVASSSSASSSGRCFYTRLPARLVKQRGLSASELTAVNLDKSPVLLAAAAKRLASLSPSIEGGKEGGQGRGGSLRGLLGELQFAFVAFVYGQSLDGYAQWKELLTLMLGCEHAVMGRGEAGQAEFVEVVRVARAQLQASLCGDGPPAADGGGPAADEQRQESPFGLPMVEELLPDSFLRKMFGKFFGMLQVERGVHPIIDR